MSKYYSGKDGALFLQGQQVAKVRSWNLSTSIDALNTTTLADTAQTFTTGIKTATGGCTVLYYDDAPVGLLNQFNQTAPGVAPTCLLKLVFDNKYLEFNAIITGTSLACNVGEIMQVDVTFQVSGEFSGISL